MRLRGNYNVDDSMMGTLESAGLDFSLIYDFGLLWQGTASQAVDLHVKVLKEQDEFLKQLKEFAVIVGAEMAVEQD